MDLHVPTDRRDRLLAALIAERPALVVLRWDPEVALLLDTGELRRLLLVTVPEDGSADAQREALAAQVKTMAQGGAPTHLVAVGGGPEVAALLKEAAPFVQTVPMGFHHLGREGELVHVTGKALPFLPAAVARIDLEAPVDPAPIAAAIARGQALAQEERNVVQKLAGRYAVTVAIMVVCAALWGLGRLWDGGQHNAVLWRMGANSGAAVRAGEWWRLLASAFLHADGVHLAVNMLALWSFGPMLEAVLGPRRYVLLYGASALAGAVASALLGGDRWSVGASGAIWGLMAAGIALAVRPKGILPALMAQGLRGRLALPLVINVAYSFRPGVDMLAHFGGGLVGFGLMATVLTDGLVPLDRRDSPAHAEERPSLFATVGAAGLAAAMVVSVAAALIAGKPWDLAGPPRLERVAVADTGVTVEVPAGTKGSAQKTDEKGVTEVVFGSLADAPVAFEVHVIKNAPGEETDPQALDATLEEAQAMFNQKAPPNWTRRGEANRVKAGDLHVVEVEHDAPKGLRVKSYWVILKRESVLVRGYARPDRPATWADIERKVVGSLREE